MSERGVTTISGEMVDNQVLEEFEATLRGEVIHAGDEGQAVGEPGKAFCREMLMGGQC